MSAQGGTCSIFLAWRGEGSLNLWHDSARTTSTCPRLSGRQALPESDRPTLYACQQMSTLRVLHLSDLHARAEWKVDQQEIVAAALDDAERLAQTQPFDLVVVSGDLAFAGQPDEYEIVRAILLEPLSGQLKLPPDRIILCPGNHDVDRAKIDTIGELGLLGYMTDRERVNEVLDDPTRLGAACERLAGWADFHDGFYAADPPDRAAPLAFTRDSSIAGIRVGVAALNSAWRCAGDQDRHRLLLGDRQVKAALDAIDAADVRLVVAHHPMEWLAPFDADEVRGLLEQRMSIVLSGHDHSSDPTGQIGSRGQAVYSRTGCLYGTHRYRNTFHVLDVDPESGQVTVNVRGWSSKLRGFDAALDEVAGGTVSFNLPTDRLLPVPRPSYTPVLQGLGELAHEMSVVADRLIDRSDAAIDDLVVARRFWPLPYEQVAAARQLDDETEADSIDAVAAASECQVVIVGGDGESGVTSALLWLLAEHFKRDGERLPAYIQYERGFSKLQRLERAVRLAASRVGLALERGDELPPSIIAVDDVDVSHSGALNGFARHIAEHPDLRFILGCHGGDDAGLAEVLDARGVTHRRVYLGPFGRAEMRELIDKLTGESSPEMLDQVFDVVLSQQLPRSPFIMAALVAVLREETDVRSLNVSGLLDAYVKWLLGGGDAADFEGLGMDYRRREHLLGWLASVLVRERLKRLPRQQAERQLLDYFEAKGYTKSSARVLDSLIGRRILVEDPDGIGFRHPAFLHLFAGRAMLDDRDFAGYVMRDPFDYHGAVQHAAGLRRSDRDLLVAIDAAFQTVLEGLGEDVTAEMFDHISTRPGWSHEDPSFAQLKEAVETEEPKGLDDDQLDLLYDQVETKPRTPTHELPLPPLLIALGPATGLLGSVLRSSELVDDVGLKTEVFKHVVHAWSLVCIVTALREDQTSELRERLPELFSAESAPAEILDRLERLTELVLVFMMVLIASGAVGSQHLQRVIEATLDDEDFMASSAHSLFATLIYCHLEFRGWPDRLAELYESHRRHPLVVELVRMYAMISYRQRRATGADEQRLENFLVDIYADSPKGTGGVAVIARATTRSALITQLRQSRDAARAERN
jgi:predicted MPP superfamily phosphohydrolase